MESKPNTNYRITNYKIGVVVKKNLRTQTMKLSDADNKLKPATLKFRETRGRYLNPNTKGEMLSGEKEIVKMYKEGYFEK